MQGGRHLKVGLMTFFPVPRKAKMKAIKPMLDAWLASLKPKV
jgi:hypothetical protein